MVRLDRGKSQTIVNPHLRLRLHDRKRVLLVAEITPALDVVKTGLEAIVSLGSFILPLSGGPRHARSWSYDSPDERFVCRRYNLIQAHRTLPRVKALSSGAAKPSRI